MSPYRKTLDTSLSSLPPADGTPSAVSRKRWLREAFSLIEVNMAILVVAGGILTIFALFPAGLRLSTTSLADMRHSMFAAEVFSGMQANAAAIESLEDWTNPNRFWALATARTPVEGTPLTNPGGDLYLYLAQNPDGIPEYFAEGIAAAPARYRIRLNRTRSTGAGGTGRDRNLDLLTWRVSMNVADQPDIDFTYHPVYHLELRFNARP